MAKKNTAKNKGKVSNGMGSIRKRSRNQVDDMLHRARIHEKDLLRSNGAMDTP